MEALPDPRRSIVEAELGRILSAAQFANSERLRGFLSYVVRQVLDGQAASIKEFAIGCEVYKRRADYDPKTDAIVRVECGRLRGKLLAYYAGEGAANPLRIELPKGTYVPVFQDVTPPPAVPVALASPARDEHLTAPPSAKRWWVASIAAALLIAGTIGFARYGPSPAARGRTSGLRFAVEPFLDETQSGKPAMSFTDQTKHRLSQIPGIALVDSPLADFILKGSLSTASGHLHSTFRLLRVADGYLAWSADYESTGDSAARFETDVAALLARTITAKFAGLSGADILRAPAHDPEAVKAFAEGSQAWSTQQLPEVLHSVKALRRAADIEPNYAEALSALAESELLLDSIDPSRPHGEWASRAKADAELAIRADSRLPVPHAVLGNIALWHHWDFRTAELELARALDLDPGHSPYSIWYTYAAILGGHAAEAFPRLEFDRLANPRSEDIPRAMSILHLAVHQNEPAERAARLAIDLRPGDWMCAQNLGIVLETAGRLPEAEKQYEKCGRGCLLDLAHLYARSGRTAAARQLVEETSRVYADSDRDALQPGSRQRVNSVDRRAWKRVAILYAEGNHSEAVRLLQTAFDSRDDQLPLLSLDPRFADMRKDPAIRSILSRITPLVMNSSAP